MSEGVGCDDTFRNKNKHFSCLLSSFGIIGYIDQIENNILYIIEKDVKPPWKMENINVD